MSSIPVLYYHSVADHFTDHPWAFLSCPVRVFYKQMNYLYRNGYNTCNWEELFNHIHGVKKLPSKTVMLHFDDGFLDNWSVVFPIMKKYGLKYSIVITPEFIEESGIRPFVDQTNENNKKDWWGYLSRDEIKKMSESGLVDFQAHGFTHTWYPCSDKIVDIKNNSNFYPHLLWNLDPINKPYWLTDDFINKVPLGYPIFEYSKSLENENRFIPNPDFIKEIISMSTEKEKPIHLDEVQKLGKEYQDDGKLGRYEDVNEYEERIRKELLETRVEIERITKKPVQFLVYPGGGNTEKVNSLAKSYGYKLVSKGNRLNSFDSKLFNIKRVSGFHDFKSSYFNVIFNLILFKIQIKRAEGNRMVETCISLVKKVLTN